MVIFGPSGTSEDVEKAKMTRAEQSAYLRKLGLFAYEHPFTYGANLSEKTKQEMLTEFKDNGISLSVHAPYYINFANPDPEKITATKKYLLDSIIKGAEMGADRVVFHPGSLTGLTREEAFNNCKNNIKAFVDELDQLNIQGCYICPETMGKHGQIGTWQEIAEICALDDRIIPCLDFGHINAYTLGELNTKDKYREILNKFVNELHKHEIHIHFSRIEYTSKGEKKHLTLDDESDYGPDFHDLLDVIDEFNANFRIISESNGTQTIDANKMKEYYKK